MTEFRPDNPAAEEVPAVPFIAAPDQIGQVRVQVVPFGTFNMSVVLTSPAEPSPKESNEEPFDILYEGTARIPIASNDALFVPLMGLA